MADFIDFPTVAMMHPATAGSSNVAFELGIRLSHVGRLMGHLRDFAVHDHPPGMPDGDLAATTEAILLAAMALLETVDPAISDLHDTIRRFEDGARAPRPAYRPGPPPLEDVA